MSVLFLRRRRGRELSHVWAPCDNGCYDGHGRSTAHWQAELMGRHAAWLCEACAKGWRSWWPAAGGGVPVVDGRREARAFEEAA